MDHQKDYHLHWIEPPGSRFPFGCLNRNHQIPEQMGVKRRIIPFLHGEGKDIGRSIPSQIFSVHFSNLLIIDQQNTELSLRKS